MKITLSVAARELAISPSTLIAWADRGRIQATRSTGGWRMFDPADVLKLKVRLKRARNG